MKPNPHQLFQTQVHQDAMTSITVLLLAFGASSEFPDGKCGPERHDAQPIAMFGEQTERPLLGVKRL